MYFLNNNTWIESCRLLSVARGNPIDSLPAHHDTVLTTLVHAEQFLRQQGTNITHIVADMQLYKVALQIKW